MAILARLHHVVEDVRCFGLCSVASRRLEPKLRPPRPARGRLRAITASSVVRALRDGRVAAAGLVGRGGQAGKDGK